MFLCSIRQQTFSGLQVTISMDLVKCSEPALWFVMASEQGWQSRCTTGWIWGGVLRWITMHYIGGCGEMDNIVLRSATSPSCKMRSGDGFRCTTLVDVGRWTTLYYDPQPFCKMRCGETTCMNITIWRNYVDVDEQRKSSWMKSESGCGTSRTKVECMNITIWRNYNV